MRNVNLFSRTSMALRLGATRTPRLLLLALTLATVGVFSSAQTDAAERSIARIHVQPSKVGPEIPKGFVGISLEVSAGGQALAAPPANLRMEKLTHPGERHVYGMGYSGDPNVAFFQYMKNLGPSVLRLGGNSQDNTCWDREEAPHPSLCSASLPHGMPKLWAQAAEASGWRLTIGINLKQDSPSWALKEVTEGIAKDIPRQKVAALEIGNEPSLFIRGARPATYSPEENVKEFLDYVRAFKANPQARNYAIAGPAACCQWENTRDLETFMDGVGPKRLSVVTVHWYVKTVCGGKIVTIQELLAPPTTDHFIDRARRWVVAAHDRHLPIELAETNSVSCGGMAGVSDSFASAVWALDYMFGVAKDGFRRINFHMSYKSGGSSYNPIDVVGWREPSGKWHYETKAEPLYDAMYMFARHAEGSRLIGVNTRTQDNIVADAVRRCSTCAVKVFVINKDLKASGPVSVQIQGVHGVASLLLLRATSLSSLAAEVRYGGVQFDGGGHLPKPHWTRVTADAKGNYVFNLPNAAAALLVARARE